MDLVLGLVGDIFVCRRTVYLLESLLESLFVLSLALLMVSPRFVAGVDAVYPDWSSVTVPPYPLMPYTTNPVVTKSIVTDRNANFVADPFLFHEGNVWYMFFEVQSNDASLPDGSKEEIGVATSNDALHWTYQKIVLSSPPVRFSFPQVYKVDGNYYMVPDAYRSGGVNIYVATSFPYGWTFVSTLIPKALSDPSIFYYSSVWWMFTGGANDAIGYLYYSHSLTSGWTQHPKSPIVVNDASRARMAGRTILYNGATILRFVQKSDVRYGEKVRAYQVDVLTTTDFAEHEIPESPLLSPSGSGWNADAMHQFDPWWNETTWIIATDGHGPKSYSIGIYTTQPQASPPQPPSQNSSYMLGDVNVESKENWWGGQYDLCKFQWTQPTGTYMGSITAYLSHVASAPNNKMVIGIYSTTANPVKIAGSLEKTGLTVGWNTQPLIGNFTLAYGSWYWLYVHAPRGNNGRMAAGTLTEQHGFGNKDYDGTVPATLSLEGTGMDVCSIYADITLLNGTLPPPPPPSTFTVAVNVQPLNITFAFSLSTATVWTAPTQINSQAKTWMFQNWQDGSTNLTRTFTVDATYTLTYQ